jgi:hypothetical protein
MARQFVLDPTLKLDELAAYHEDVVASLLLYFSPTAPTFTARFAECSQDAVNEVLASRLDESDIRSAFAVLTSLEAIFRIDFDDRCRKKLKDDLSRYFRSIKKAHGDRVRLDEDILEGWKRHTNASARDIGAIRGAFKFRHWLAHGRYWIPKHSKYDFESVRSMAESIISGFPFVP